MLQSMTGFGKVSARINGKKVDVEIRSLNSKQLDLNLRLPQVYRELEPEIRTFIGNELDRGKVDFFINITGEEGKSKSSLNKDIVKGYYKELIKSSELSDKGGAGLGFVDIARKSGHKLEFDFEKVNEEYSFFSFKTKISKEIE